jgi:thioredoxin-related protein
VKWYSLEEALKMNKVHPRKIMINWYANWNISSMLMYANTFNNPAIAAFINKNYYPVRIDATTTDTLNVFGQKFINENKQHPYHQLAVAMLEGKMIFPATLFLDENNKLIDRMQIFLTSENLQPILNYYGGNVYRTTKWADYLKTYKSQMSKAVEPKEEAN